MTDLYLHNYEGQPAIHSNCAYFYHLLWAVPCMETAHVLHLRPHDPECEMTTLGFLSEVQ